MLSNLRLPERESLPLFSSVLKLIFRDATRGEQTGKVDETAPRAVGKFATDPYFTRTRTFSNNVIARRTTRGAGFPRANSARLRVGPSDVIHVHVETRRAEIRVGKEFK